MLFHTYLIHFRGSNAQRAGGNVTKKMVPERPCPKHAFLRLSADEVRRESAAGHANLFLQAAAVWPE